MVLAAAGFGGVGYGPGGSMAHQAGVQVLGVAAVCAWSAAISAVLVLACRAIVGLRVDDDAIEEGLDMAAHGERAYTI